MERSLPLAKVKKYYEECPGASKQVVLSYVTFFEERIVVGSDFLLRNCQQSLNCVIHFYAVKNI